MAKPARTRTTDLGEEEKQCARCGEWWPADPEFFHRKGDGLHSYCKACVTERCRELRAERKAREREQLMANHKVPYSYTMTGTTIVKADSREEAEQIVLDGDLPDGTDYLTDSFSVQTEEIVEAGGEKKADGLPQRKRAPVRLRPGEPIDRLESHAVRWCEVCRSVVIDNV